MKQISQEMMELGFSEYESRIYVFLVTGGGLTVYEISKNTGIPRPNVYSAVERLVARRALQAIGERPARYSAVPPASMFENISKATAQKCAALVDKLERVEAEEPRQFAYAIFGKDQVVKKLADLIRGAKRTIWLKATDELLLENAGAIRAAAARGVTFTVVLFGQIPDAFGSMKNVSIFLHDNNGVRLGIADQLFTVVRDSEEAFMANVIGEYYGVHTASPPVVRVAELLLRKDVYLAEILKRFGPLIDDEYGPLLAGLRRRFLVGEELRRFETNLKSSLDQGATAAGRRRSPAPKSPVKSKPRRKA